MSFGYHEQIRAAPPALAARLQAEDWYGVWIRLPGLLQAFRPTAAAGSVWINLTGEGRGGPVTPAQYAAAERLVETEVAIGEALVAALAQARPSLNAAFDGLDVITPPVEARPEPTWRPRSLFVHDFGHAGVALGVWLDCPTDDWRGLGALVKDEAVLGFGFADIALSGEAARRIVGGDTSELLWAARG